MMSERMTILVFVLIALAQSKSCSRLANDAFNINYRENELFQKPLADFFDLDGTSAVSLTPISTDIQIVDFIEKIQEIPVLEKESMYGAAAKISNGRWDNQFAFLEQKRLTESAWYLHITDQSSTNRLPEFVSTIRITDDVDTFCFGLAFSGDDIIIDCQDANDDVLYRYVKNADVELIDRHPKLQNGINNRVLQAQPTILARGCLYHELENPINTIEVRLGDTYIQSIDTNLLAQLLNQPNYQLQIIQFKLLDNELPLVSIFDRAGNFIILKYENNEWTIQFQDQLGITDTLKFDFKADALYQPQEYLIVNNERVTVIKYSNNQKISFVSPSLVFDTISQVWISPENYMIYSFFTVSQLVIEGSSLKLKSSARVIPMWLIPDPSSNQFTTLKALYKVNQQRYLTINGKSDGVFNLIYNTEPECRITVTLAKLDNIQIAIREPGLESIKNTLFSGIEQQDYFDNYDGAAIQYTQTVTDPRLQLNFFKYIDLKMTLEDQSSICIFKQVLYTPEEENFFFQIQQFTDLKVILSQCQYNQQSKDGECRFRTYFQEQVRLTSQNSYFYIYDGLVRGVIIRSQEEIIDYIDTSHHSFLNHIEIANVRAVSASQNYVYAITDTATHIYSMAKRELLFSYSTNFGLQNIQKIFTSPHHNKIIVQCDDKFWVGQVQDKSYFFTYAFNYDLLHLGTAVLYENNFVIINVNPMNNVQMQQFDFQDIYNVKQQFIITYDYKIEDTIQLTTDLTDNYYLVIKGTTETQYNILNFRISGVSSSALYQVIPTDTPFIITACNEILSFLTEEVDHYLLMPSQMKVETIFHLPQSEYFAQYQLEVYAQGYGQTNEMNNLEISKTKIVQTINAIQTQQDISLNLMNLKIDGKDFEKENKCFNLGPSFYSGEVTHFTVSCEKCKEGDVYMENRVHYVKGLPSSLSDVVQAIQLDEETVAVLAKHHLTIHNLPYYQDTNLPIGCVGSRISSNKDGSQLYIICNHASNQRLLTWACSNSKCSLKGEVNLPDQRKVLGFAQLASFLYLVYDDRILTYLILNDQAELKSTIMTSSQGVTYAEAVALTNTINQLYLTIGQTIQVIEFQNINNVFTEIQRFTIEVNELLIANKKYITTDTQFIQSAIHQVLNLNQQIILKLVLISTNTAHYGLQLTFNCDSQRCTKSKPHEIAYMINQYLNWKAIYGQVSNDYLGIVYQRDGQLIQTAYTLPNALTGLPQTMIGAIQTISLISVPVIQNRKLYLLTYTEYNYIKLHSLQDTPYLCVLSDVEKQYVTITGHNDKDASSTKFILEVSYSETEITSDDGSLVWLWVLLGIAVTGCIGFGLWKFYESSKSKRNENLGLLN